MATSIVIPVYRAADELARCLASLEHTVPADVRIFIADDASPDAAVAQVIEQMQQRGRLRIEMTRRAENLGFIGNVNLALAQTAPDDVILLNSDTVATPGWFEAMLACAQSDPRIATITPWSNNAEICSFPRFCEPSPLPGEEESAQLAKLLAANPSPQYPELPTGVGFCMFMRRAALDALGDFDMATFGRGYGEENDFCLRATGHGWRNVLCDTAYVGHQGGASFSLEGHHPGGENLARLNARYPHYNAMVAEFILADPLAPLRERILAALREPTPSTAAAPPAAAVQSDLFSPQ
ncbi:glycosyltransferase family 2 protein [Denitratimonas sp. CY0512]|uniref:glycosyltransferase family 2 protein n=1 Tax=Denitratimonas sp. CY0512 TaxID=3131940 RepID=UPI0030A029D4